MQAPSVRNDWRLPSINQPHSSLYGHTTTAIHNIEYTPPPPRAPSGHVEEYSVFFVFITWAESIESGAGYVGLSMCYGTITGAQNG